MKTLPGFSHDHRIPQGLLLDPRSRFTFCALRITISHSLDENIPHGHIPHYPRL